MKEIYTATELMAYVQQIGFLPLLDGGVAGFSAEEVVADDCRYVVFPDGGWDWPLWKWKGEMVTEDFVYPTDRLKAHFHTILPTATDRQIEKLLG